MRLKHTRAWGILTILALISGFSPAVTSGAGAAATPLIEAAKRADMTEVRAILRNPDDFIFSVQDRDIDGTSVLHWATYYDDLETVDLLLIAGANASTANRYGVTPLWLASVNGNATIVERLLAAGADPKTPRTDSGETLLMIAARSGHIDVMQVLLKHDVNVNAAENHRGQTALMWAAAEKHPSAVKLLLKAGADMELRSSRTGMTALMFAIRTGDIASTKVLLDAGGDLTATTEDGTSALILAILNANFELADFLLEQGADPNIKDPHGNPLFVLTWLRRAENRSLANYLIRTTSGSMDSFELGKSLLAHGADINAQIDWEEENGRNLIPQHLAIGPYFLSFVGATSFYIAAMNCDVPYMKFLAENGADATLATRQHVTPLLIASGIGFIEGEHPGNPSICLEAVKLTHELGNDPLAVIDYDGYSKGSPNWDGATALHGAATRGADEMVEWLVEKGAPLDARTEKGMTAWDIADGSNITGVFHRWIETATLLAGMMEDRGIPLEISPARGLNTYSGNSSVDEDDEEDDEEKVE